MRLASQCSSLIHYFGQLFLLIVAGSSFLACQAAESSHLESAPPPALHSDSGREAAALESTIRAQQEIEGIIAGQIELQDDVAALTDPTTLAVWSHLPPAICQLLGSEFRNCLTAASPQTELISRESGPSSGQWQITQKTIYPANSELSYVLESLVTDQQGTAEFSADDTVIAYQALAKYRDDSLAALEATAGDDNGNLFAGTLILSSNRFFPVGQETTSIRRVDTLLIQDGSVRLLQSEYQRERADGSGVSRKAVPIQPLLPTQTFKSGTLSRQFFLPLETSPGCDSIQEELTLQDDQPQEYFRWVEYRDKTGNRANLTFNPDGLSHLSEERRDGSQISGEFELATGNFKLYQRFPASHNPLAMERRGRISGPGQGEFDETIQLQNGRTLVRTIRYQKRAALMTFQISTAGKLVGLYSLSQTSGRKSLAGCTLIGPEVASSELAGVLWQDGGDVAICQSFLARATVMTGIDRFILLREDIDADRAGTLELSQYQLDSTGLVKNLIQQGEIRFWPDESAQGQLREYHYRPDREIPEMIPYDIVIEVDRHGELIGLDGASQPFVY
jgi:hypothetical protein